MTGVGSAELLRALGSATGAGTGSARPGVADAGFSALLESARRGDVASARPVTVDAMSGLELSGAELAKVASATDQAAAAGARRAVVLIGDKSLEVDVLGRRVVGRVDLSTPGAVTGIDAIVRADGASVGAASGPAGLPGSASLLKVLEEAGR